MKNSKVVIVLSVLLVCSLILLIREYDAKLGNLFCDNTILESVVSPDKQKIAVVYVENCGATTGWVTELVLLDKNFDISSIASVISNNGEATPKAVQGWPIIKPIWNDDKLLIYHSANADIEGLTQLNEVNISYSELDQSIIEKYNIEVR